jgi:hypothetical protein
MKMRAAVVALLVALLGFGQAFAAGPVKNQKLSALAKARDRDERGRFLSNPKHEAIEQRAYFKFLERSAKGEGGSQQGDFFAAKRELQMEARQRNAEKKAAKVKIEVARPVAKQ